MADWTDELRAEVISQYTDAEPTAETSVEIMKDIEKETGKTVNGIRMILTKAGVYVKTVPAKSATKAKSTTTRVSKQDAIDALTTILESEELKVDEAILSKLTGKAAVYFAEVVKQALGE
jgi:hypothetical protein